jgi:transcriptional regulator with XRE-family HTH domain
MRLRIQEVAKARGFSAAKLGRRADLGYGTVYGLWTNANTNPGLETLEKIARVLGVKVCDLFDDIDVHASAAEAREA